MTAQRIDYYVYIKSPEWFKRTESVRARNRGICECCNMRQGSCVHHRSYENLGKEKEEELLHVCEICHNMIHKKKKGFIWPSRIGFLILLQQEVEKYEK